MSPHFRGGDYIGVWVISGHLRILPTTKAVSLLRRTFITTLKKKSGQFSISIMGKFNFHRNSYIDVLTPSISEHGCIWR